MKIGLLTFHSAHNYGAVLQAYATQEKVKELGYDIEVINYCPDYLIKQKLFAISTNVSFLITIKSVIESFVTFPWRIKRKINFEKFINQKLNISKINYKNKKFTENLHFDTFIMGSDQVWNCKLTKGFDPIYLGNFKTKQAAKKISYAASMSHYGLTETEKEEFSKLLFNFNAISVREKELENFIKDEFQIESTTVLDPTFILSKDKWMLISVKPKVKSKYVLVYSIDLRDEAMKIASKLAQKRGLEIIELTMGVDKNIFINKFQTTSPEEYLGLFENADFVVTSSFHGTAFSLIFNKSFYSLSHGNDKDSRQKTILKDLGLMDRFIKANDNLNYEPIDYSIVNPKLENLRQQSIKFLTNNLF